MSPEIASSAHPIASGIDGPWRLPSGWEWVSLGDALSIRSGTLDPRAFPEEQFCLYSMPAYDADAIPELRYGKEIRSAKTVVESGDVLLSKLNPRIPRVWCVQDVSPLRKLASTDFLPLVIRKTMVGEPFFDSVFATRLFLSPIFRDQVRHQVQGATGSRQRIRREHVIAAILPRPLFLNTQRQVAAKIEELMAELREGRVLAAAIRNDADRIMAAALEETARDLEGRFEHISLGEFMVDGRIRIMGGGTPSKLNEAYWYGPLPWVSPKDMKRWVIDDAQDHISELALDETSAKRIPRGAVLMVVRGMILAHTWPIAVTSVDVAINQDMKALCPDESFRPEYLGYVLRARSRQVLSVVETSAHGTRRLRTEYFLRVLVPDAPLSAQDETIAHLDEVASHLDEMRRLQEKDHECLEHLEQAILEVAFRGEL